MKLTKQPKNGEQYITPTGTILRSGDRTGAWDSLGNAARCAIAYDENETELLQGIENYFIAYTDRKGTKIYVIRHPDQEPRLHVKGNSRDHVIYAMSCLKQIGYDPFVKAFLNNRAKRPSIDMPYTPGQKLFFKALYSKPWSWAYFAYSLPGTILIPLYNFILRLASWTLKTYRDPADWFINHKKPTKYQKRVADLLIPPFSSFYKLYEINAIASTKAARILRFLMRLQFEKTNYVAKALCGKIRIPDNYTPSRSNRWTVRLDDSCNRDIRPWPGDTEENSCEIGLLKYYCSTEMTRKT